MPETTQDQMSPEDVQALIHAQQHLFDAGDPRAAKVYNFIVQGGYAKRGAQGELLPMDTMGAPPTLAEKVKGILEHPMNSLNAATQPVSRPAGASIPEMASADLANVAVGAANVIRHPVQTAKGMVMGPVQAVMHPAETFQQLNEGGPEAGAQMLGQGLATAGLTKAIGPVAAEVAPKIVPKVTETGTAIASKAQAVGQKLLPSLIDGPPESLMTRAVKPGKNNINWNTDVQKAIPLMKSAEEQLGRPVQGVDDALDAAALAKKNIWQQYQSRMQASGQTGAVIDGNAIADAMVKSIDNRTAMQNPGLVQRVQNIADTYRRPIPLSEAEDFLQSANKDLNTYYTKNKVGQQVALNDSEISSTVAEAGALRSALYNKLDQITGPGAAQLKQAYGSLTNVEKELYGRQLVAARQNPESLSEQLSTVAGAGKIAKGVLTLSPGDVAEGVQNVAVSRALKARNTSDAMIARAFQAAKPASPFPAPSSPRFAGLLERGPIQVPPPADASGPTSYQPPPVNATTRAQRKGLLLPAQAGGKVILPYYPEMSAGEKLAALKFLMSQRRPTALPAKASAIHLPPPR